MHAALLMNGLQIGRPYWSKLQLTREIKKTTSADCRTPMGELSLSEGRLNSERIKAARSVRPEKQIRVAAGVNSDDVRTIVIRRRKHNFRTAIVDRRMPDAGGIEGTIKIYRHGVEGGLAVLTVNPRKANASRVTGGRVPISLVQKTKEAERERIARELHDTLLQGFTGISLKLHAIAQNLPVALAGPREQLRRILEQSDRCLTEARRAVCGLRSASLESAANFSSAVIHASKQIVRGTGIRLRVSSVGPQIRLAPIIEENLLRICEECVCNSMKHARSTRVEIIVRYDPSLVTLQVRDYGCGFEPKCEQGGGVGHFGLAGLRERVKSIRASVTISSGRGRGTEINVKVPIASSAVKSPNSDTNW